MQHPQSWTTRARTWDLEVNSFPLCRLSYGPIQCAFQKCKIQCELLKLNCGGGRRESIHHTSNKTKYNYPQKTYSHNCHQYIYYHRITVIRTNAKNITRNEAISLLVLSFIYVFQYIGRKWSTIFISRPFFNFSQMSSYSMTIGTYYLTFSYLFIYFLFAKSGNQFCYIFMLPPPYMVKIHNIVRISLLTIHTRSFLLKILDVSSKKCLLLCYRDLLGLHMA